MTLCTFDVEAVADLKNRLWRVAVEKEAYGEWGWKAAAEEIADWLSKAVSLYDSVPAGAVVSAIRAAATNAMDQMDPPGRIAMEAQDK